MFNPGDWLSPNQSSESVKFGSFRTKVMAAIVKTEKRLVHVVTHSDYSEVAS